MVDFLEKQDYRKDYSVNYDYYYRKDYHKDYLVDYDYYYHKDYRGLYFRCAPTGHVFIGL